MSSSKKPRTNIDFSKHSHRVEIFKSEEGNEIRIDHLQIDRNRGLYLKFINTDDTLTVSGDFGNYVFCRPFVPSPNGSVSDMYWHEKLQINSIQNHDRLDYDFDSIIEELEAELESIEENYSEDEQEEVREYIQNLIDAAGNNDKLEYEYAAYRSPMPSCIEYDFVPEYKQPNTRLQIVFDGFEEICSRLLDQYKSKGNRKLIDNFLKDLEFNWNTLDCSWNLFSDKLHFEFLTKEMIFNVKVDGKVKHKIKNPSINCMNEVILEELNSSKKIDKK